MRLVFAGSPADAVPMLEALVDAAHEIALVITQPDRRRRRRADPEPSPVRSAAERLGLKVVTPERSSEVVDEVAASGAVLGVVVAFGQLLPRALLDALPHGFVNVHFSLLPAWRGAAPVERAILAGDERTGVSVMEIEEGLDSGPVYAQASTPIGDTETAGELHARLVTMGTELLLEAVESVPTIVPEPQSGPSSYADKLTTAEFELDWSRTAEELARLVRAGNPRPGAWTTDGDTRVKVWRAEVCDADARDADARDADARDAEARDADDGALAPGTLLADGAVQTGNGKLVLAEVQPQDRRAMSASSWMAGRRSGTARLGSS
ncbi:MAG: methionyl-tRNA formyltransferase [Acidimicrobiia bacterium]|nr:methionyl-tRNA formyltransferase [Acidimicrobiia bacterium]